MIQLLLILAIAAPVGAQVSMSVTPLLGGAYVPDAWTPLRVEVSNSTDAAIEGVLSLKNDHTDAPSEFQQDIRVPARAKVVAFFYACLPERDAPIAAPGGDTSLSAGVIFKTRNGAERARTGLVAEPVRPGEFVPAYLHGRSPRLLVMAGDGHSGDETKLCGVLSELSRRPIVPLRINPSRLPSHPAGYDSVAVLWLGELDPDELDEAQRFSIRQFVLSGGVVVIEAFPESAIHASWMAGWIPVRVVGIRALSELPSGLVPTRLLCARDNARIVEALPADGAVVLTDHGLVYAAHRPLGLGRIVFTSFPFAEADWRSALLAKTLESLWPVQAQQARDACEQIASHASQSLPHLIGPRTLGWSWAAGWTGAFVLVSAILHIAMRGVWRSVALLGTTTMGVSLAVGLLAAGRSGDDMGEIRLAGMTSLAVDPASGASAQVDVMALLGSKDVGLSPVALDVDLRAIQSDARMVPLMKVAPFLAPSVPLGSARLQSIWKAQGVADTPLRLAASFEFTRDAPRLVVRNDSNVTLEDAVLAWNPGRVWRLGELPPGSTQIPCERTNLNETGSFLGSSGVVTPQARIRSDLLLAASDVRVEAPAGAAQPMIFAWLKPGDQPSLLARTVTDRRVIPARMTVVCIPVDTARSSQPIRITDDFCQYMVPEASTLPFDFRTRRWTSTAEQGVWRFGIRPPPQTSHLHWSRMKIEMEVIAPRQRLTLRHAPSPEAPDGGGGEIGRFIRTVSANTFNLKLSDANQSTDGTIWLELSAEQLDVDTEQGIRSQWHVRRFEVTLDADEPHP